MDIVVEDGPERRCKKHNLFVLKGLYVNGAYTASCGCVDCPVHGLKVTRAKYFKAARRIHESWPFRCFILWFKYKPNQDELNEISGVVRAIIDKFDRNARTWLVLHPLHGHWHLNIGLQSWWFSMDAILGSYWCPEKKRFFKAHTRPKTYTWAWFEEQLHHLSDTVEGVHHVEDGQFTNPNAWLWYCLRCTSGWDAEEQLPIYCGHGIGTDRRSFKKKKHKPATVVEQAGEVAAEPNLNGASNNVQAENLKDIGLDTHVCFVALVPVWMAALWWIVPPPERRCPGWRGKREICPDARIERHAGPAVQQYIPLLPRPPPQQAARRPPLATLDFLTFSHLPRAQVASSDVPNPSLWRLMCHDTEKSARRDAGSNMQGGNYPPAPTERVRTR
jgi:hypothetical protein